MTDYPRRRRLIEVAFPLEEVSADSRKDPYRGSPHPQTLHRWWARRPLAACRAFIYASLVDDPETDAEREELLKEVADLASWAAVRYPGKVVREKARGGTGLTGTELLERARRRILDCNDGKPPRLLDPFAGGGAIPLEGLRLGCEVEASDLNPVAVLILKGTLEYPQKYGQPDSRPTPEYIYQAAQDPAQARFSDGDLVEAYRRNPLAADVRYWGHWMLVKAREELAEFYPPDPDGSVPVAYLWSHTIPCLSCRAEMPLIRQYWLARKDRKEVALKAVVDIDNNRVDFQVVEGSNVTGDPAEATTSRGDTKCVVCGQVVKGALVRQAGVEGRMSATLTSVVLASDNRQGKSYREDVAEDAIAYASAVRRIATLQASHENDLSLVPDEPMPRHLTGGVITAFGFDTFGKLFNARQLLALTTFTRLVGEAHVEMRKQGLDDEYAKAVATYLGLVVSRLSSEHSALTRWNPSGEKAQGALGLQALPMVWDFAELNPWGRSVGDPTTAINLAAAVIEFCGDPSFSSAVRVALRDAREDSGNYFGAVITDPPYYDAINYADLADFYYVWLKRSLGPIQHQLLSMPMNPKREQIIMNVYGTFTNGEGVTAREQARQRYVDGMAQSFQVMAASLESDGVQGVVFAHTDPDAWATLIEGLFAANLVPEASWPIETEMGTKVSTANQARLKTSVWMACRKRAYTAGETFLGDVMEEMRPAIRERLLYFWSKGIRGADFFISAIGPALSVFGRHSRVLRPSGEAVTVREFLDIVRRESTDVALEQVLHGADLGVIDPVTRQYVTWVWSYSKAPLDAGEAIALCLATGAAYDEMTRPNSIAVEGREKSKKMVKLRTIRERAMNDDDFGYGSPARPTPLVDQLQYAAWLWGQNQTDRLAACRGELGESRWTALRTLGQAVAECLPDGDEDRRIILGLLGSNTMGIAPQPAGPHSQPLPAGARLPGFEPAEE